MSITKSHSRGEFRQFGLHESLNRGIEAAGFKMPRPIQAETIPAGLRGRDVLGLAQTGTGKTAAFALPLLDRLLRSSGKGPQALVLAPTRELATQIAVEIRTLARFTKLEAITAFGGVEIRKQIRDLRRNPEIIVGCPGRVLDLVERGVLRFNNLQILVVDEADHMFDMGFLPDVRRITRTLPKRRQNLMFSATMPREIRRLADDILYRPHVVELAHSKPVETVEHAVFMVAQDNKKALLKHVLDSDRCDSTIVFTRTKHRARRLAAQLTDAGHRAVGLQGNMSQAQRTRAMDGFRSRRYDILVATDIAARGIDVSGVSHVINFDVPNTPDAYTHRIGRTGRSDADGIAYTFVTSDDRGWLRDTERMIGSPIPRRAVDNPELAVDVSFNQSRTERTPNGGSSRRRRRDNRPRNHRRSRVARAS